MDIFDQDLLDRFAIAAMPIVNQEVAAERMDCETKEDFADLCYALACEMKKARDRACGKQEIAPLPVIDLGLVEGAK